MSGGTWQRVSMSEIAVGQPLAADLYGEPDPAPGAQPALRRGAVPGPGPELEALVHKGLFIARDTALPAPSALHTINAVARALEDVLHALPGATDGGAAIRDLARQLVGACAAQPAVAQAAVLLGQVGAPYALRHCVETTLVAACVARALGRGAGEIESLACAALSMNVGMLGYHEQYQNRRGALDEDEKQTIHRHPHDGALLLSQAGVTDADWLACVAQHHESPDGGGYPSGRRDMTADALLLSLADRYCAAVSARNYRRSQLPDQALRELAAGAAHPAVRDVLAGFEAALGAWPPGTRVRLADGRAGVVLAQTDGAPRVAVLEDAEGEPCAPQEVRAAGAAAIAQTLHEDQADMRFSMKSLWGEAAAL